MALRVGPRGLPDDGCLAARDGLRVKLRTVLGCSLEDVEKEGGDLFLLSIPLVRGTTNSELERTRGIRLFN